MEIVWEIFVSAKIVETTSGFDHFFDIGKLGVDCTGAAYCCYWHYSTLNCEGSDNHCQCITSTVSCLCLPWILGNMECNAWWEMPLLGSPEKKHRKWCYLQQILYIFHSVSEKSIFCKKPDYVVHSTAAEIIIENCLLGISNVFEREADLKTA